MCVWQTCPSFSAGLFLGDEADGSGVDPVAQSVRQRAVIENKAQMCAAVGAGGFDAIAGVAEIFDLLDVSGDGDAMEAGVTATGVELGVRVEQFGAAAAAVIGAFLPGVPVISGEGTFRAFQAGDSGGRSGIPRGRVLRAIGLRAFQSCEACWFPPLRLKRFSVSCSCYGIFGRL